jgi:uncharacterized protein (DUF1697 family)
MTRQVALLRGINVGGNKRVAMADLRALLESLGYTDVRTLLQSGNAVYTGPDSPAEAAAAIEAAIVERLGMRVRVLVRTRDELAAVVAANPLAEVAVDGSRHMVVFLSGVPARAALAAIDVAAHAPDRLVHPGGRELYAWCPAGIGRSLWFPLLDERRLGVIPTARNWNTVTKLLELADA